jgi:hypothetical protein
MTPQEVIARILALGPVRVAASRTFHPEDEGTYSIGQYYDIHGDPFILAQSGPGLCVFIHLTSGNRWKEPRTVENVHNLTQAEFDSIGPHDKIITRIPVNF